jgi:uncharacterized protein YdgA (DUF945 family)
MKRVLTVAIVMAAVLVGAPWVIGNVAEDRVNRGLDRLVEAAPYLGIVERKFTQGWFRSEQEVTFELVGPFAQQGPPPNAAIERVQAGLEVPRIPGTRFTVRNEILHGPVPGFSGFGLARVNSRMLLDEKTRQELIRAFGTDEPFALSTRVGFFGGNTTTLSSEARTARPRGGGEVSWDDLEIDVSYTHDLDSIEVAGDWPRFEVHDEAQDSHLLIRDMVLDAEAHRVQGHLFDTDIELRIAEFSYGDAQDPKTTARDLHYVVDTSVDGDFMGVATRVGSGRISGGNLAPKGLEITATHYDFTVRRLHTGTLAGLTDAVHESYRNPAAATRVDEQILALLARDPELVLDRLRLETAEGAADLRGVIRVKGATGKDLRMGLLSLIARLDVDLRMEAPQKLIEKLDGGRQSMLDAVAGGYVELQGDKVVSRIEFHDGELMFNGKVQGIPGLGPPAPDEKAGPE